MVSFDLIRMNLLSPMVLSFFLGLMAVAVKSDIKLPKSFYSGISVYLLLALGLKGGAALSCTNFQEIVLPIFITVALGVSIPFFTFASAKWLGRFSRADSAALAAHYGSVSVVTFMAAEVFVEKMGFASEGFMSSLVAILEVPGIVLGLLLAKSKQEFSQDVEQSATQYPATGDMQVGGKCSHHMQEPSLWQRVFGILVSKSILLLLGGLLIGFISGKPGLNKIAPFFIEPFQGVLVLFMLDMGLVAGERLGDLRKTNAFLVGMAFLIPVINGFVGVYGGYLAGLSIGGATVLGAMAASASYIAAPAAVRISIPQANPAYYLTAAIVLTFPFNLSIGVPLYYKMAVWIFS